MRIYYYHTRPIKEAYEEWKEGKYPGHILYGLTHFSKYGIDSIFHPYKREKSRFFLMFYCLKKILFCKEKYDVLYGTSFRGIELIIFLRALGLYRKPIAIWHHTAIVISSNKIKNWLSKFFYQGIDQMFLFSQKLIDDSLKTGKVKAEKLKLIHWGADLDFYQKLETTKIFRERIEFISTGKENRDFNTLLEAFSKTDKQLEIFTAKTNGDKDYEGIFKGYEDKKSYPNIFINYVDGSLPYELACEVANSETVVICCLYYPYTVGLTTLVEAFALGKPVIVSKNPYFEMNVEKEGAGLTIDYGDVEGWIKAINYLAENDEIREKMSQNSLRLATETYNLENYSRELAEQLLKRFDKK